MTPLWKEADARTPAGRKLAYGRDRVASPSDSLPVELPAAKPSPHPLDAPEHLFETVNGSPHYRGLGIRFHTITLAGRALTVAALADAADLLDQDDYARKFIEEDRAPYGLELWPASIMLAEHVLAAEPGRGRRALELGCGLGLVAMAATIHGWQVIATDHEESALQFARHNAGANSIAVPAFELLDWREPPQNREFDLILAADVLYQLVDHAPILTCVKHLLAPTGRALIVDPNRSVADRFPELAEAAGFEVSVTPVATTHPVIRSPTGRLYTLYPA